MNYKQKDKQYIANTYNRFDRVLVSGSGATCLDDEGAVLIDFGSGIGVNSLGFAHTKWADAVAFQAKTLQHVSNLYFTKPCVDVAEILINNTGFEKVFFANSGAEAVECCIKTARKYSFDKYGLNRHNIITLCGSFHGRTMSALTATGQDTFHEFFFPFDSGFRYAEPNDFADMQRLVDDSVCAIMIEVVQGEGGVNCLDTKYVECLAKLCEDKDILLIVDEVQTGIGRTGKLLASGHYNIKPDLISLAKGLGGGLPIGVCLLGTKVANVLGYGNHGTTYGGNPIVCAGSLVVLDEILNGGVLAGVKARNEYIMKVLAECDQVESVSGLGLMLGISLKNKNAIDVLKQCLDNGLMVLTAKQKIRLLPPLNISMAELEDGMAILKKVLEG